MRMELDSDCRKLQDELNRESEQNYQNKMTLDKDKQITVELSLHRFDRDFKLMTEFKEFKVKELADTKTERAAVDAEFKGMGELQTFINDAIKYRKEIDEMHVKLAHQSLIVNELESANDVLLEKKETLDKEKKETSESNDDQARTLKAKEEANVKRMIAKLQRDKNPIIKELIQKEEDVK